VPPAIADTPHRQPIGSREGDLEARSILMITEAVATDCYVLATGVAGAARLALLDQVYAPDATQIMTGIGIPCGGRIADIGCGTGNTARWFAHKVGPRGTVTAVDVSADQLQVARSEASGHDNIQFVNASAYDTGLPRDHFDLVHCRFLLCHLTRPLDALREMAAIAKPRGIIICFDIDISGLFSLPATACYARVQELIAAFGQHRGTDDTLGVKLPRMFLEAGLVEPQTAFVHPVFLRGEQKRLWEYTFLEASPHFVRSGLTNEAEVKRLSAELAAVAADETVCVAQGRMPVTWARKGVNWSNASRTSRRDRQDD
jgi:ubiquinone/menaquinone biosynthesis C-methylase UbiE